jgi:uncharacterized protein YqhQ
LPFCFKGFLLAPSSFQAEEKKKNHKKGKKNTEKGKNFPLSSCSALSLCAPTFALLLLPFYFKHFLLASFSSQVEERKKNNKKEKNAEKGGREPSSFHFALSLLPPVSAFLFLPFCFKHLLLFIFFFSSRKKNTKKKKP